MDEQTRDDRTLTELEWEDARDTVAAPYRATVADRAEGDPQVWRALAVIERALGEPDPARRSALAARAAVVLLADPDGPGTPYRCKRCGLTYSAAPAEPDWRVAGSDDWLCWLCVITPDPLVAIEAPGPPDVYTREHADVLTAVSMGEGADGRVCAALARRGLLTQDADRWALTEAGHRVRDVLAGGDG